MTRHESVIAVDDWEQFAEYERSRGLEERIVEYCEHRRQLFPRFAGRFETRFWRHGFLSSMYRLRAGSATYLLAFKHHGDHRMRAQREFEVLSALDGKFGPRPVLVDTGCKDFPDPFVITEYQAERPYTRWDTESLETLAAMMASIHLDSRLAHLQVDRETADSYSLSREFEEEVAAISGFRPSRLRALLVEMGDLLRTRIQEWETVCQDGVVTYIHGDLPHRHVFRTREGLRAIHWEFSRRSHPARELGRAFWDLDLSDEAGDYLMGRYQTLVPFKLRPEAVKIQEMLQHFYECIHVTYWMDRSRKQLPRERIRAAEEMTGVVHLWIRIQLGVEK